MADTPPDCKIRAVSEDGSPPSESRKLVVTKLLKEDEDRYTLRSPDAVTLRKRVDLICDFCRNYLHGAKTKTDVYQEIADINALCTVKWKGEHLVMDPLRGVLLGESISDKVMTSHELWKAFTSLCIEGESAHNRLWVYTSNESQTHQQIKDFFCDTSGYLGAGAIMAKPEVDLGGFDNAVNVGI